MTGTPISAEPTSVLDSILPAPRLRETDTVNLAMTPALAWQEIRYGDLADSRAVGALFTIRGLPGQLLHRHGEPGTQRQADPLRLTMDSFASTAGKPGFQLLAEESPHEVVVGAVGKVWRFDAPFVHVADAAEFAAFDKPGFIKVGCAIKLRPLGDRDTQVVLELRVGATDDAAWRSFRRYFAVIGPGSRFIRRSALSRIARRHGTPEAAENGRPLPGDELLPDATGQVTHAVTIHARPDDIWPWLAQMGCGRGGFYSIDMLDNGGKRSAREIHDDLQQIAVGEILPATPSGESGFEVLHTSPPTELILGGLFDQETKRQLPFDAPRPADYWHVTWAFILEPRGDNSTRLHVRARGAFPDTDRLHAAWLRELHQLMQRAQLRHIAARAEGRLRRDDWRDVLDGAAGAAVMATGLLTPFRRGKRGRWGVSAEVAARRYPGDELIEEPLWGWTHGIEVNASSSDVWPWVAQIGADRGGFYSYQWLENLAGCKLRNAESIHPEWAAHEGGALRLHPDAPAPRVVSVAAGRYLLVHTSDALAGASPYRDRTSVDRGRAHRPGKRWLAASWLLLLEPLRTERCRVISRYRCATSDDLVSRLQLAPAIIEPISFAMDRRMLLGIRQRAERLRGIS